MEIAGVSDLEELEYYRDGEFLSDCKHENKSSFGDFSQALICYGWLRYPYGLDENNLLLLRDYLMYLMFLNSFIDFFLYVRT